MMPHILHFAPLGISHAKVLRRRIMNPHPLDQVRVLSREGFAETPVIEIPQVHFEKRVHLVGRCSIRRRQSRGDEDLIGRIRPVHAEPSLECRRVWREEVVGAGAC